MAKVFFDSNIILYVHDKFSLEKSEKCSRWFLEMASMGSVVVNIQILNEVTNVLLRKKWLENTDMIFTAISKLSNFGNTPVTYSTIMKAKSVLASTNYSWWDCLLLASALELDCSYFLSEDMSDGQIIKIYGHRNMIIVNPITHSPKKILNS